MLDLAFLARRLRAGGRRLRITGAQPQVRKLIKLTGVDRLPAIKLERSPVLT